MKKLSVFLIAGLFSLGLCVSGLVAPHKVLAFLDLFGAWDPSLIFTMGGALLITSIVYFATRHRQLSMLGEPVQIPTATALDARLLGGSLIFGIGWGLSGVCPGPALVNLGLLSGPALVFVAAMIGGMALYAFVNWLATARTAVTVDA